MLYLAQVEKRNLVVRGCRIRLLAMQRSSKLWTRLTEPEIVVVSIDSVAVNDDLIFVQLDGKRRVIKTTAAIATLPDILHDLSSRLLKCHEQEKEIELWRESLEYQARELAERAAALEKEN